MKSNMIYTTFLFFAVASMFLVQSCANSKGDDAKANQTECFADRLYSVPVVHEVAHESIAESITLSGDIQYNQTEVSRVYPFVSGLVTNVRTSLGARVQRGQLLATVQSRDIADMLSEKVALEIQLELAEEQLEVVESMFERELTTRQELQAARSEVRQANAELNRLTSRLELLGATRNGASRQIIAPRSGFIVEMNIASGTELPEDFDDPIFVISSLDKVWVVGHVYESDIRRIKVGQTVNIKTMAYPDTIFKGTISNVSGMLDPVSRVMTVRVDLPNPEYLLKPGMFARMQVQSELESALPAVPSDALIFDNNRHFVVIRQDACNFIPRIVEIRSRSADKVYIAWGLEVGETIVSADPLMIYNAL